ncbi:MAG: basic amino acid ABC transporter substrate-binding protein [Rickettsiales bacterium]|jgi:polar amino acid transport system substrate-binding protein|nr:basic amino acid ABC transporter substrate-binding protein [Rickettsiales bacterium]
MRKILLFLFGLTSVFLQNNSAALGRQSIKVGTSANYAPFEFIDKNGKITGFEIDIITEILKNEEYDVVVEDMPFDGLIPAVISGSIDVGAAGLTMTEDKEKQVSLSKPFFTPSLSIVVKSSDKSIKDMNDLVNKRIGAEIATNGAELAKTIKGSKTHEFDSVNEAFAALLTNSIDAVISDADVNAYFFKITKEKKLKIIATSEAMEPYIFITSLKNKKLINQINNGIEKIKKNGKYDEIRDKWFK